MPRVLLFSNTTGYQLRAFDDAAASLGIDLVFATDRCHHLDDPWQDRAIPVRFEDVESSVAAVLERAASAPVDGVLAVGDRPMPLAAAAARAVGVRWHSPEGAAASLDKRRSHVALHAAGIQVARFTTLEIAARFAGYGPPPPFGFPVVVKPVRLSGSRGVIRANDAAELDRAIERVCKLLARPEIRATRPGAFDEILVEEYIDGAEFAVEGVMTDGALTPFAIFDKPDPLEGPYFEETLYVTPSRLPMARQQDILQAVERAARALGLVHGPLHAECRVTSGGAIYILEVTGRPIGGLCSRVLRFPGAGAPASLESVLLRHAAGERGLMVRREADAAAVMMIPIPRGGMFKGVSGVEAARRVPGVTEVHITAKAGQVLEPLPEAGSYLGFIFARDGEPAATEAAVRAAHARLSFAFGRALAVTPA